MFREMRRRAQQLPRAEAERILAAGQTAVLAVLGDGGYPYAVPVNYVYREGRVDFHCARAGHKLDAIRACPKVSLCVVDRDEVVPAALTTHFRSVVAFGTARILSDPAEIAAAAEALAQKYACDAAAARAEIAQAGPALCCVEITIEHLSGKQAIELARAEAKR